MPIYMDRHYVVGITRHAIANAHEKDLAVQSKYGIQFLTYWMDEERCTGFCLVDSPDKATLQKAHDEAHGQVPSEIIEVNPATVEVFLGRISDPLPVANTVLIDSAFRVIMVTDLKDSTGMITQLGESTAMHLLRVHNALTRNALRNSGGREVKHMGDGIMASFADTSKAIECVMSIQKSFAAYNSENAEPSLHLRIGLSAGEPVEEDSHLFGAAVNLAVRICAYAQPDQILVSQVIVDQCPMDKAIFSDAGKFNPKGFPIPVQVYQVNWQSAG
ncbi:MAG: DUF4242 domain-containing protein [Chloroflexi bacterium]|nr:DUF4242 domain-containing protein [Chloroflexota bacterium]